MIFYIFKGTFLLGLFLSVTSGQDNVNIASLVNCSSVESLVSGMQKCLDLYDVPLTLPSAQEFSDVTSALNSLFSQLNKTTITTLCSPGRRGDYISSTLCIHSISKKCASGVDPVLDTLLGSPDQIRQQVEFQCQTITDLNQECIVSKLPTLQRCMNTSGVVGGVSTNNPDHLTAISCLSSSLARVCARRHLADCGEKTLQIYFQQLPPVPAVCSNLTGSNRRIDCSSEESRRKSYLSCQVESGVFILLPKTISSDEQIAEYTLRTVSLERYSQACSQQSSYDSLINCTLSVKSQCTPVDEQFILPHPEDVQKGLKLLCTSEFNSSCITSELAKSNMLGVPNFLSNRQALCSDVKQRNTELVAAVGSCDEKTVSLYRDLLTSQLPVQCSPTVSGGSTLPPNDGNTGPLPSISPCLLLTALFLRIMQ